LISLTQKQETANGLAHGMIMRGWALAERGQVEEGIAQMHEGLTGARDLGIENGQTYFLALMAEAYGKGGQTEEGLQMLAAALAMSNKIGEHFYEAELYRLKGELPLQEENQKPNSKSRKSKMTDLRPRPPDPQGEAEACFLKAVDIAQKQQAKSLELRATMSLSRLWQQQGKKGEAHKLLSEVYNWFTEGFDTKDLQEAKALLEELRQ
jgi:predicted ATPase